jgi:DNA-binding Lrp family transcriptional regulator
MVNEKELAIISHLRKDSRTSLAVISEGVEMPSSTIYDRIIRLQRDDIIKSYTVILDFKKLGLNHHTKIALKVNKPYREELLEYLKKQKVVNSISQINSGFDFMVETLSKDIKEHIDFVESLKSKFDIVDFHQYQVVEEIFKEKLFKLV